MKALVALYKAAAVEFLRDRVAILLTVLLPVIMAAFFGMIFANQPAYHLELGIAALDRGPVGESLAKAFTDPALQNTVTVHTGTRDDLVDAVKSGKVAVALILPESLTANVSAGRPTPVEVIWDKSREAAAAPGVALVRQVLQQSGMQMQGVPTLLPVQENVIETRSIPQALLYVPGMMALAMLWMGIFTVAPPLVQVREARCSAARGRPRCAAPPCWERKSVSASPPASSRGCCWSPTACWLITCTWRTGC